MNPLIRISLLLGMISALVGIDSLSAQIYYDNGRQVCCGDSLLTGRQQALGINPAHLGRARRSQKSFNILSLGGNLYANGLDLSEVFELSFTDKFLNDTIKQALIAKQNPAEFFEYNANLDVAWLAFSVAGPKFGGIAVDVQDRVRNTTSLPNDFISLLLLGQNSQPYQQANSLDELSHVADGSSFTYSHIREVRIGYGRRILDLEALRFYAGFTYKYLMGIGYYGAKVDAARFAGVSAFSDFYRINYGQLNFGSPSDRRRLLSSAGSGHAFDIGLAMDIGDKINVAAAVIDVGNITWREELVASSVDFAQVVDSIKDGLVNSYEFTEEVGDLYDLVNSVPGVPFEVKLNTHTRISATIRLSRTLNANAELITPLRNDALRVLNPEGSTFSSALTWSPVRNFIRLSSGVYYNSQYGWRWPLGISIGFGRNTLLSLSTTDLSTFLGRDNPFPSLSVGTISVGI